MLRLSRGKALALAAKAGVAVPDPVPRTTRIPAPDLGAGLDTQCRALGLPCGTPEFLFHPTRKWRSDRAWPAALLLLEIDGGSWLTRGGHTYGKGFERDRKDAEALVLGWRVLRVTPAMVRSGEAVRYVAALLGYTLRRGRAVKNPGI